MKMIHGACVFPCEHLDEIGSRHREEGPIRLARHRARKQGLPRPRRTHEQRPLREPAPETRELLRILQELDDLLKLVLGLIAARHVRERHLGRVATEETRFRLPETEGPRAAGLHLSEHEQPQPDDQHPRQELHQHRDPAVAGGTRRDLDALLTKFGIEFFAQLGGQQRLEVLDGHLIALDRPLQLALDPTSFADVDGLDVPACEFGAKLRVVEGLLLAPAGIHELKDRDGDENEERPKRRRPQYAVRAS